MIEPNTGHPHVTAALAQMAALRQAPDVTPKMLDLFASALAAERLDVAVIVEACRRISRRAREDGEPAFPTLGALLAECRTVAREQALSRQLRAATAPPHTLPPIEQAPLSREEARALVVDLQARVEAQRRARGAR